MNPASESTGGHPSADNRLHGKPRQKRAAPARDSKAFREEMLDVSGATVFLGLRSEKALRARIARRSIPFRRWGGRIVLLRSELSEFLQALEGVRVQEALDNLTRTK